MSILISAVSAVLAGLCLAASGVLQQRAAAQRPSDERMSLRLVVELARDRGWVIGIGLAVLSYGFQALALSFGPLILVQPLIVSELLFAIPASVRLRGLRLGPREWCAVVAVVAGLAVGMVSADPQTGQPVQPLLTWIPALVGVAVVVAAGLAFARFRSGPAKAGGIAFAGACAMGLQSALYDATITLLPQGFLQIFLTWEPYLLIAVSLLGAFLVQNAYQAGPLAASTPVMDSTLPLVAIALGVGLFGETVRTAPWALAGTGLGLSLLLAGILGLDSSPVVRKQQRIDERERNDDAEQSGSDERAQA
ncbi:MAG TPA: DMT family transporter [Nocardioides sp.]|uniref:DMT family transporter n=1 Tax=Nocardioides sp. TaxID=35761 RepID=UPI002F418910